MPRIPINLGTPPSGVDGDPVRTAFEKVNTMTEELYQGIPTDASPLAVTRGGTGAKTAADARTNLGISLVSGPYDPAAGKILSVGYAGLGVVDTSPFQQESNPDNLVVSAHSYWGTFKITGFPDCAGFLSVFSGSGGSTSQVMYGRDSVLMYMRSRNSGQAWQAWRPVMMAGDFGIGAPFSSWQPDLHTITVTKQFVWGTGQTANLPDGADYGEGFAMSGSGTGEMTMILVSHDSDRAWVKRRRAGTWQPAKAIVLAGDFGIGGLTSAFAPSFDGLKAAGIYRFDPNTPGATQNGAGGFGTILHQNYDNGSGNWTQMIQSLGSPRIWARAGINNTIGPVGEMHSTYNSQFDPALNTGGLMSVTTISGWVIEKFINGTMIATNATNSASIGAGNTLTSQVAVPAVFVGEIYPAITIQPSNNFDCYGCISAFFSNSTTLNIVIRNGVTAAQSFTMRSILKGRWK